MTRLPVAALIALATLALAGTALADPLDPKVKLDAADQARAKAALIVQGDLGNAWTNHSTAAPSSLKAPVCPALRPDYSKLTLTGHAESVFDLGAWEVSSDVEVWKSVAQATKHMNALLQPALPTCIKYSLLKSGAGAAGYTLLAAERRKLATSADVNVAYRVPIAVKVGAKSVLVNSDFILLRKGRTEIYMNVTAPSSDARAIAALEARLAKTAAARVRV
jgi:hypothetical protein